MIRRGTVGADMTDPKQPVQVPNDDELLDVLGPDGTVIGQAGRDEVHQCGHWHRTFHCLAVRTEPPARVILQRRSRHSHFAHLIDLTATGHLQAGEEPVDGVRELEEEAGIVADRSRLIPLGVHYLVDDGPDAMNREQIHVFLYPTDAALGALQPDPEEVDGLLEVEVEPLLALLDPRQPTVTEIQATERSIEHSNEQATARLPRSVVLTKDDLVDGNQGYFIKVLIMAERLVNGQSPLAI